MQTPAPTPLISSLSSTWPLLLGFALMTLGGGLQGTLLGVRAALEEFPVLTTGLVMSAYFVGFLVGSRLTVRLVSRVGHVRVFAAMTSVASITILAHAVMVDAWLWVLLRFFSGVCFAGIYIVVESWLNERANNETRGRLFSVYMMIHFAGLGFGQFLLNIGEPVNAVLFMLVSILVSLAAVPLVLSARPSPSFEQASNLTFAFVYGQSPVAVFAALISGLASGAIFGMGAVFAAGLGLTVGQIALFMAMPIFGAMLLQWPLGLLSDRMDRRLVIELAAVLALLAAGAALTVTAGSPWFLALMALLGGATLPVYGLAASHLNDRLDPVDLVAGSSTMILLSGIGAALGPILSGSLMSIWGTVGFLWFFAAINAVLLAATFWRLQSEPLPEDLQKHPWQQLRPLPTPVAATVVAETQAEQVLDESGTAVPIEEAAQPQDPPATRPRASSVQ